MSINGISSSKASSTATHVLAGKTARPCDSCLIKRARWFCAADDAFLCQSCDAAVHSANQLASRHQRVRLETASSSACKLVAAPAWHPKKPRTPRHPKSRHNNNHQQLPLVPEMGSEEPGFLEENDEVDHLLFCRVPVFEPFEGSVVFDDDHGDLNLDELLSSCNDEFAADVESLLGKDEEIILMDEKRSSSVKVEEKEDDIEVEAMACHLDDPVELSWEFNDMNSEFEEERKIELEMGMNEESSLTSRTLLRLNYEAVIAAWSSANSPWADGIRPDINLHDHDFIKMGSAWLLGGVGDGIIMKGRIVDDAGREARVSRYRDKRRTRLFSKKIRYEVRKLNAEKRPRMKGRFVKRSISSPNYHRGIKS